MKTLAEIRCPGCGGKLVPVELRCEPCALSVKGHFASNEFGELADEELHFLRIFVLCEGHIREMESALGVSYPTIKSRLAKLKEKLARKGEEIRATPDAPPTAPANVDPTAEVLRDLEKGRINFEDAMKRIHHIQKEGGR